MSAI
jgi:hypothetical protein